MTWTEQQYDTALGYQDAEIERLRAALRDIVRMACKGADAPMTAERWLDRIDETAINALSPKEPKA